MDDDWKSHLGREVSATDQPPGTYRYRTRRNCPWQPVRIMFDGYHWHCLLRGVAVYLSCQRDPLNIPFVREKGPFHAITMRQYHDMLDDYRTAKPGSPLLTPDDPVDLKGAPPI